jgi:hypothetical protein
MRSTLSVVARLNRIGRRQENRESEEQIAILAEEFGLHPEEVRRELEETKRHHRRFGPESMSVQIGRLARELDLDEAAIRREYELVRLHLQVRRVVR